MTLTFLGAARTVTGSKHLLEVGGKRVFVDCGLFQGLKGPSSAHLASTSIRATDVHAVIHHAHLDHSGYLPRLVSQGFADGSSARRPAELTRTSSKDAGRLQEDAERANRKGYTKHQPALPLFTEQDAARALTLLQPVGSRPIPRDAWGER